MSTKTTMSKTADQTHVSLLFCIVVVNAVRKMDQWVQIFPPSVDTMKSSTVFMKQLTTIAISTIVYTRNLLPLDSYVVEKLGGLSMYVLKQDCKNEVAQFVSQNLISSYDAFDKKYVKRLALCLYEGENTIQKNLIECWSFDYFYHDNSLSLNVNSKDASKDEKMNFRYLIDNIRDSTMRLLRAIVVITEGRPSPPPDDCVICLRLYYNENAPEGYEHPGFAPTDETQDHLQPLEKRFGHVQRIATRYHEIDVNCFNRADMSPYQAYGTETPPVVTQVQNGAECRPISDANSESSGVHIRCSCLLKDHDEELNIALLTCHVCNTVQHAACYGITREGAALMLRHCCVDCSDADKSRVPTDLILANTKDKQRKTLCLHRRIVDWCSQVASISVEDIMVKFQLRKDKAIRTIQKFHSMGIIKRTPGDDVAQLNEIDQHKLKLVISELFNGDNTNIVDKLIAESLSQDRDDPVRDILKTSDVENLQKTSKTSEILKPFEPSQTQNSTLKEYKDAIMVSNDSFDDFKSPFNTNKESLSRLRKRKIPEKVSGQRKTIKKK